MADIFVPMMMALTFLVSGYVNHFVLIQVCQVQRSRKITLQNSSVAGFKWFYVNAGASFPAVKFCSP